MRALLTDAQVERQAEFRAFAAEIVAAEAERWDEQQALPRGVLGKLARAGYLGCTLPRDCGGMGSDVVTFGLLNEALGRASSALTGVVTVQTMVAMALFKWGTPEQKRRFLPALASGDAIAAFALTEPGAGSDLAALATEFQEAPHALLLNGTKKWISCAQFADVFLVFGRLGGRTLAALVPRAAPGVRVEPILELMGFRAAGLAQVEFEGVRVPAADVVGRAGFALSHVAQVGLHYGRLSTACSALGLLRGCFEESATYAALRSAGGRPIGTFGTIRSMIARMGTDLEAAGALCLLACRAEDERAPAAYERGLLAKYFTSRAAVRAASDAVQIRGASGCQASAAVSRYYRDAKVMEIIEGTTQIHEELLGKLFVDRAGAPAAAPAQPALLAQVNRTTAAFPDDVTIHRLIEQRVALHPEATAVVCDHDAERSTASLTYAQLEARANRLAGLLARAGVGPGEVVALLLERSYAMLTGILGVLKAGAAYLPLPAADPPDRLGYLLSDAGVRVLLAQRRTLGRVAFRGRVVDLDDAGLEREDPASAVPVAARDLAYVIYTSGSTGRPKGVMIEHRSLVNRLHWMQQAYPIGADDVILQKTPYSFDVSVWELLWWAIAGARLCLLAPGAEKNPKAIVDAVEKHRVTVLHFVPSMLSVLLEYLDGKPDSVRRGLSSVRRVFASGEALSPIHVKKFNAVWGRQTGARLTNLYGPTEATIDVSYFDCPPHHRIDSVPIGRPIHNTRLYVVRDGRLAAVGEAGELCIAGVGLARGYLNNPALTAERFVDNPVNPGERIYRTGDVARLRGDGEFEYLGREDHQVKIRGLRIELGEIENTIREYPGVADCAAVVRRYSETVVLIVAYLVCDEDLKLDRLKRHLKQRLPEYMVPHRLERLRELPLTPSGKLDRKALPETLPHAGYRECR
jgi:amino acid adenylation domain-containing protein